MPRHAVLIAATAALVSIASALEGGSTAHADSAAPPPAPALADRGLAVLAAAPSGPAGPASIAAVATPLGDSPVWKLARGVYADASLRPAFDEAHARALAGEAPAAGAPADVRDLAETRAGIHGDDGASKRLLASLAAQLHVRGVVVVTGADATAAHAANAKVFLTGSGQFDAATYAADASGDWSSTVSSLSRAYGASTVSTASGETVPAPTLALTTVPPPPDSDSHKSRPFYYSPWFWGAVGAAALGGVAVYFATRDSDPSTIHLQLTVPGTK